MNKKISLIASILTTVLLASTCYSQDDDSRNILKQGLLGAGTGAIASGASGGNAGQGALIGAGTNVVGGALLDMLTGPSQSSQARYAPAPQQQYYDDQGGQAYYYEEPPQESSSAKIIKQGLLGAGTGALASSMSGGNAGKGALIGAGTNVIGGALLDAITTPSQPKKVYYRPAPPPQQQYYPPQPYNQPQQQYSQPAQTAPQVQPSLEGTRKKVIRKYDDNGKVISEEEIYY
jgi:hypothetical protein